MRSTGVYYSTHDQKSAVERRFHPNNPFVPIRTRMVTTTIATAPRPLLRRNLNFLPPFRKLPRILILTLALRMHIRVQIELSCAHPQLALHAIPRREHLPVDRQYDQVIISDRYIDHRGLRPIFSFEDLGGAWRIGVIRGPGGFRAEDVKFGEDGFGA